MEKKIISDELIKSIRDLVWSKGRKFPIGLEMLVYKCKRCGTEWHRYAIDRNDDGKCPLADCQGSLITKLIRLFKKEDVYSYGEVIRGYKIETGF